MQEIERDFGDMSTFEEVDGFCFGLLHCVMWLLVGWGLKHGFFIARLTS